MENKSILKRLSLLTLFLIAGFTGALAQKLSLSSFTLNAGETKTVMINLDQVGRTIYGLQTDVVLSNGLFLNGDPVAVEGAMADPNPSFSCSPVNSGGIRVVMFSMNGQAFVPGQQSVIALTVSCSNNFHGGTIQLKNSRLTVSESGKEISVPGCTAMVTTGQSGSSADLIERTMPNAETANVPETAVAFEVGKEYILYNVTAQKYFTQGNNWGTRGCVGPKSSAVLLKVAQYKVDDAWDGKTYEIENYVTNRTAYAWYKACMDDAGNLYLDQSTWDNRFYEIQDQGSNTYRLMPNEMNALHQSDGTQFVGRDDAVEQDFSNAYSGFTDDSERYPLSAMVTAGEEGHHVDWQFFDATTLIKATEAFEAAKDLKSLIEQAEELGVNVGFAVAVYNNLDATTEEINAAIDLLGLAISGGVFDNFIPGTALDVTQLITNPDFKGDDLTTGWSGSGWGAYNPRENAERFQMSFDTYQVISGLRPGLYVAGVNAFYRAGGAATAYTNYKAQNDDSKNAKLYVTAGEETFTADIVSPFHNAPTSGQGKGAESNVKDEETEITYYIPNNMVAAEYYMHNLGLYKNSLFFNTSATQIQLGLKKEKTITDDWVICDDFSLVYCGEGADAYNAYVNYYKTSFPDYASQRVSASQPFFNTEGLNYSWQYYDALMNLEVSAQDAAGVAAAIEQMEAAHAVLKENIALWAEFLATVKQAYEVGSNEYLDIEYRSALIDWAEMDAEEQWEAQEMSNEELRMLIDEMNAAIKEAYNHPAENAGEYEVTNLLVNPAFEEGGLSGWTNNGAWTGGTKTNTCIEAWNSAGFDTYQIVKNAPQGIYRIEVQGFYRYGRGQAAYDYWVAQEVPEVKAEGVPVYVYMNKKKTPFSSVFDEPMTVPYSTQNTQIDGVGPDGESYYYPDGMVSSAEAFSAGMYKRSAYGVIRAGQDMRVGVTGVSNQLGDSWVVWDNFKLFNCGKDAKAVLNVLPDEIEHAKKMTVDDEGSPVLMGKTIKTNLEAAIAAAEASLESGDGETMFNALSDLFDAEENVDASIELFAQLKQALNDLEDALGSADEASATAVAEAGNLIEDINTKLANSQLEDEDVPALLEQINNAMTKLGLSADINEASDLNPIDVTKVIKNASFDDNNANGWSGDTPGFQSYTNGEFFNKNFNFYQDIKGLPAGTYELRVQGFYRAGLAEEDYNSYMESPVVNNNAFLYAMTNNDGEDVICSKPMVRLASGAITGYDDDGYIVVGYDSFGNDIVVPNSMATGAAEFDNGNFAGNSVIVKLEEGQTLRVGLKKNDLLNWDWTLFDNFQLLYYGTHSSLQPDDGNKIDLTQLIAEANRLLNQYMQSSIQQELQQLVQTYSTVTDRDSLLQGQELLTIYINMARQSIDAYSYLRQAIDDVNDRLTYGQNMPADVVAHATTLVAEAQQVYAARDIDTDMAYDYGYRLYDLRDQLFAIYADLTIEEPGTFYQLLEEAVGEVWNVQSLKVSGTINDEDLDNIRELWNLRTLDLSGVTNLEQLPSWCFEYRENLQKVELPASLLFVGEYAFADCWNLQSVTCHAAVPPVGYDRLTWDGGITLYVPAISVEAYQNSYPWNNWNVQGIDELPESFTFISDFEMTWPDIQVSDSVANEYKPKVRVGQFNPYNNSYDYIYGALTMNGNSTVSLGEFNIVYDPNVELNRRYYWGDDHGSFNATLLNYATNMRADNVTVDYWARRDRWTFFSLPFDVKVSDIELNFNNTPFAIRKYDGAQRAAGAMNNTWVNMTADSILRAGEGYIIQSTVLNDNREYNGFFFKAMQTPNKNNIFACNDVNVALNEYPSDFAHNQNWNLVGNPYPCYYNIKGMQTTAPITVWNQGNQLYEAYSPMDDNYVLNPNEAFFVQRPVNQPYITFIQEARAARRDVAMDVWWNLSRSAASLVNDRAVFNFTLSDGATTDRTRVVFNESANTAYEQDKDASKFMSMNERVPQIYTVDGGLSYAINERPIAKGELRLGVHFGKQGTYTIAMNSTVSDCEVYLVDLLLNKEVRLDGIDGYTFEANEGTVNDRFCLRFVGGVVTGIQTVDNEAKNEKYYNLNGVRIEQPKKGLYLKDGKKVVVK